MNKFLNFSFKFGKIFTVILLVILMIAIISSGIKTVSTFKNVKLKAPTFVEIQANMEAEKQNQTANAENKNAEPYILVLNEVAKKHLSDYGKRMLTISVKQIDEEYRIEYLNGFDKALDDAKEYCNIKKLNDKQANELLENIISNYNSYFARNKARVDDEKAQCNVDRIVASSVLGSSILLFLLCLIIPLLIKIEENTRK